MAAGGRYLNMRILMGINESCYITNEGKGGRSEGDREGDREGK